MIIKLDSHHLYRYHQQGTSKSLRVEQTNRASGELRKDMLNKMGGNKVQNEKTKHIITLICVK